jgi:vesicle coat complex subunit
MQHTLSTGVSGCTRLQAVRAIGRCAVSLEKAAQRCIGVLLELIGSKVNYVVQEAVIVIKVQRAAAVGL